MASEYRGVLKVAGSQLRGWLMDAAHPNRRVRFNLVIDGDQCGTFAANRWRRFFVRQGTPGEDSHGFSIAIRKPWISGGLQTIRLEDPDDSNLKISLRARLGSAAHTHFDEHVVGGQVSIGSGEPIHVRHDRPAHNSDKEERDTRQNSANRVLLRQLSNLSDADLANLLLAMDRDIVLDRLKRHEKSGDWESAAVFQRAVTSGAAIQKLITLGRGAVKAHNYGLAGRVTAAAAALQPQSFDANYLAGAAKSLLGEYDEAMRYLSVADKLEEGTVRAKREMVIVLARQMRGEMTPERRSDLRNDRLSLLRGLSASQDPQIQMRYRVPFAEALFVAGRYEEAATIVDGILAVAPNDTRALMVHARTFVARNRIAEAHQAYEHILEIDPQHRGAMMNMRLLMALNEDEALTRPDVAVLPSHALGARTEQPVSLVHSLAEISQNWICTTQGSLEEEIAPEVMAMLDAMSARRTGYLEIGRADGRRLEFWRRDVLIGLAESGLLESLDDQVTLARWKQFYASREHVETASRMTRAKRGVVALISRNGAELYGGGEHFLENAAVHHARQGFSPVIVGTRADLRGDERALNGRRCVFVGDKADDMRRFLLENDVSLVHAISGTGFAVADALNYTNIPFLYGVHFWNELLGDPEQSAYFDDVTGASRFRREFPLILSRATAIYANSHFTQKIIEDGFGIRCPVVFPVPRERSRAGKH